MKLLLHKEPVVQKLIAMALREDLGAGDMTSHALFPHGLNAEAGIYTKQAITIAGAAVVRQVFQGVDPRLKIISHVSDGTHVPEGRCVITVKGSLKSILAAERTALNFFQRLSGVATLTSLYVKALGKSKTKIYDTRKTLPGWRKLDKYAVRVGGGCNHRMGLFDGILLKENHLHSFLSRHNLAELIDRMDAVAMKNRKILEVEVRNCNEAVVIAQYRQIGGILFDNMPAAHIKRAIEKIKKDFSKRKITFEASGGITILNIKSYAHIGLDRISVGALTHSAPAVDFSLLVRSAG